VCKFRRVDVGAEMEAGHWLAGEETLIADLLIAQTHEPHRDTRRAWDGRETYLGIEVQDNGEF